MAIAARNIWAVVPVKRFDRAKRRLAPCLTQDGCAALARVMLEDVLDVLTGAPGLDGVLMVTGDPTAAAIGRAFDAEVIDDPAETGTNAAVALGLRALAAGGHGGALVVPGDIPFLSAAEVEAALAALRCHPMALTPARRDGGTNILGLMPPDAIAPSFGADSFARHQAAARAAGIEPAVLPLAGAGLDIDVPADLRPDARGGPARRTRDLLFRLSPIGASAGVLKEALP